MTQAPTMAAITTTYADATVTRAGEDAVDLSPFIARSITTDQEKSNRSATTYYQRLDPLDHVEVALGCQPLEEVDRVRIVPHEDAVSPALDAAHDDLRRLLRRQARDPGEVELHLLVAVAAEVVHAEARVPDDARR